MDDINDIGDGTSHQHAVDCSHRNGETMNEKKQDLKMKEICLTMDKVKAKVQLYKGIVIWYSEMILPYSF